MNQPDVRNQVTLLHGPARSLFESWRALGRSEAHALEEVKRSGILEEQRKVETDRTGTRANRLKVLMGIGLSEAAARDTITRDELNAVGSDLEAEITQALAECRRLG